MENNIRRSADTPRKRHGRVYTPAHIVNLMLDLAGYKQTAHILHHHIIDNSCGDGAFLTEIVRRYCRAYLAAYGASNLAGLPRQLSTFIHGIEIDEQACKSCVQNLEHTAREFGVECVAWDVVCADTLKIKSFEAHTSCAARNRPPY